MIIVNGNVFGQVVINGKVVNDNIPDCKQIDETKAEAASNISCIDVRSHFANVNISIWDNDKIQARLHGNISKEQDISLNITKTNSRINISVDTTQTASFFFSNDLLLEIQVPSKLFEEVNIENENGNISINSLRASGIVANCDNGNITSSVCSRTLTLSTRNGNVHLNAEATCDINLQVNSKNGNVSAKLFNISKSRVEVSSKNGNCSNRQVTFSKGIHNVFGNISTKNGNITFEY